MKQTLKRASYTDQKLRSLQHTQQDKEVWFFLWNNFFETSSSLSTHFVLVIIKKEKKKNLFITIESTFKKKFIGIFWFIMAVGIIINSNMANRGESSSSSSTNPYDRSRFTLDLSSPGPSTSRLRHWDMSPTDASPVEVVKSFEITFLQNCLCGT